MCSQLMTYEARLHLDGLVNKRNFRYWRVENITILNGKELHQQRVAVWCAVTVK